MQIRDRLLAAMIAGCFALVANAELARADVPPPEGLKRVPFRLAIDNLKSHPEWVFLVYPWSLSNGAPTAEVGRIDDKGLRFGRRISGRPQLYAMKRADFEQAPPPGEDTDGGTMPLSPAVRCDAPLERRHQVEEDGPDEVVQTLHVASVSAERCSLVAARAAPVAAPSPTPDPQATPPEPPVEPTAQQRGCASCVVGTDGGRAEKVQFGWWGVLGAGWWLRRRLRPRGRVRP